GRGRHSDQSHTSSGFGRNGWGVASSSGRKRAQSPLCASRKVGIPLSAEIPAPVNATTRRVFRSRWTRRGSILMTAGCGVGAAPRSSLGAGVALKSRGVATLPHAPCLRGGLCFKSVLVPTGRGHPIHYHTTYAL